MKGSFVHNYNLCHAITIKSSEGDATMSGLIREWVTGAMQSVRSNGRTCCWLVATYNSLNMTCTAHDSTNELALDEVIQFAVNVIIHQQLSSAQLASALQQRV